MKKIHLFAVLIYVIIHFFLSLILVLIPGSLFRLLGVKKLSDRYIRFNGILIARGIITTLGGKVSVSGLENLPKERQLCFVSNHRSLTDIPLIVGYLPVSVGFIAKSELKKIPILNTWMDVLGCVYIDRKNPRSQVKAILDGAKAIANGHPQLIFPEGTRSRIEKFGHFKPGSIKLATRSKAVIIPLTILNSSSLFEAKSGIKRNTVELIIHEPIPTADLNDQEIKDLPDRVFSVIKTCQKDKLSATIQNG
jgi:1-acyl-sn-glycerol-3-phosphate acyltransferase